MAGKRKILIVDDEAHIVELLAMNLRQHGFETCTASNGLNVLDLAVSERPDLILLDLMLPGISGLEACRLLKTDSRTISVPVIMLTAKSEESDKVIGLGIGADDYVTKPFGLRELIARIEVALRRTLPPAALAPAAGLAQAAVISIGSLEMDEGCHEALLGGGRLFLSPTEFDMLATLARNKGRTVRRAELMDPAGRSLDVHMRNLRKKLGDTGGSDDSGLRIETVRGVGYRLHA